MEVLSKEQKVTLTKEDMEALNEFYGQFNVEMSDEYKQAIQAFIEDPTFENEQKVTLYTLKNQAEIDHPVVRNKMFDSPSENCKKIAAEIQFELDLIETIGFDADELEEEEKK